ncbi:MAG: family deacetylase, partial [Flavipsychrobacter sp.]|nr:family deacetylase [Flavipsychrobacter sp.]
KHVAGEPMTNSLFDGIDISWKRVKNPEIDRQIDQVLNAYDFRHPENSLPALLELREDIAKVKDNYWRTQKLAELDEIILHSTGLMAELYAKQPEAVAGSTLPFTMRVVARSSMPVTIQSIAWPGGDTVMNFVLPKDSLITMERSITIPATTPVTEPYWLQQQAKDIAHFVMPHDTLRGYPEAPNNLNAIMNVKVDGRTYPVAVPLSYKKLDPTRGDVIQNIRIVPAVTLEFTAPLLVTAPDGSLTAGVRIHTLKDIDAGMLFLNSGKGAKEIGKGFRLAKNSDTTIYTIYTAKELAGMPEDFELTAVLGTGDASYTRTKNLIQYEHIPTLQYFTRATTKVLRSNWQFTAKRIGYIEGAGDLTADILRLAGLQVDVLKDADISADRLKKYDAILTGIRAVNVEKRMPVWMPELMRYVANGGTLVMQYNTLQDMSTTNIGPYPITLGRERVTEEDAVVEFIIPDHRLLNHPNKITQSDFAGWVQERGLYYPLKYDEKYQAIFKMNDTGEQPLTGGTLYTQFGKGHYVYAPLSFFRQLPAGNKGAIRLLLNMLSVGK